MRGIAVGLMVLAIGRPAMATDLIYNYTKASPEVLAPYNGFAHWQLQSYCSGMMQAHASYDKAKRRDPSKAEAAAQYFQGEATARYIVDRGADEAKAQAVVAHYEQTAKDQFAEQVKKNPGFVGRSPANMRMTECAAVAAALSPPANVPPPVVQEILHKQRVICEEFFPTGSHRPKRLCHTVADAEQDRLDGREQTERIQEMSGCRDYNGCR